MVVEIMEYLIVGLFAAAVAGVALYVYKPEWFAPLKKLVEKLYKK
jgi:hypothetical protein